MKNQKNVFMFVAMSEYALVGYSLTNLKIIKFLPVPICVQISVKAVRPTKAMYNNRQARIFYANILSLFNLAFVHIKRVIWASPQKIVRSLFKVFNINTGSMPDLFLPLDRSDRTNDRQLKFKNKTCLLNLLGGLGDLFFPLLKNFTLSN
jgi:hypothetical protein